MALANLCFAAPLAVFGVLHLFGPRFVMNLAPGYMPVRVLIDYVTGAALLVAGGSILLTRKTRTVATCLGGWILLMVLVICGPVLIMALSEPGTAVQVEGINYFADTMLFAGAILALASATPRSGGAGWGSVPRSIRKTLSLTRIEPSASD